MINWRKATEVPKENVPLFYNYDNGTMNYIDRGYYYAKTFKNWHYDTELNSEHIKSWCYEDELFETIPKEIK